MAKYQNVCGFEADYFGANLMLKVVLFFGSFWENYTDCRSVLSCPM